MSYFNSITQNVVADSNNSSSTFLPASGSFVGISTSTLGVAGIQVSLFTDQNCDVYVDQSPDGENWDISDLYEYFAGINNFGITTQAINSYFRVRVVNKNAVSSASPLRLQTALCPIVEALPRSLSDDGYLKTAVMEITDGYGFEVENTPTDEMRTVIPYRLVGSSFNGSVVDTNYWTVSTGSASGSVVLSNAQAILTTGSSPDGLSTLQSFRTARYVGGASNKFRCVMRLPDTGVTGNRRRWGAFSTTDGAFFELNGNTFSAVTRKNSVDTPVSSGSFNGKLGHNYYLDTVVSNWEIYWTNTKVYFVAGGDLMHTMTASNDTWSSTMNLPIRFETTSGSGTNMNVRVATIYRLGSALSQPTSYYHASGTQTGINLKLGAGNLHSVLIAGVANGAILTLIDNVTGSTPVIFTTGAMPNATNPFSLDFKGLPFFTGLRLIVSAQNCIATVIYE